MNVKLTWTDNNTNEDGHRVYRSSSPMDVQALPPPVAELGPDVTEWEDTGTPVDQESYYIVSAVRGAEEAFSDEVRIDTTTAEEDPHWNNVVALLHFDGDLTDETGRVWESVGSSVVSSDESVFGDSSLKVPTTAGLVRAANSADFDFGSGDFTIEFFLRPSSVTSWASYLDKRESGSFHAPFAIQRDGTRNRVRFSSAYAPGSWPVVINATHPPLDVWTHVVYERWDGVFLVFINGVQVGSVDGGSNSLLTNTSTLNIAATGDNADGMNGYIDELRITKGVARYTENFTPPTEPFPNQ